MANGKDCNIVRKRDSGSVYSCSRTYFPSFAATSGLTVYVLDPAFVVTSADAEMVASTASPPRTGAKLAAAVIKKAIAAESFMVSRLKSKMLSVDVV